MDTATRRAKPPARSLQTKQTSIAVRFAQSILLHTIDWAGKRSNDSSTIEIEFRIQLIPYDNDSPRNWTIALSVGYCAHAFEDV